MGAGAAASTALDPAATASLPPRRRGRAAREVSADEALERLAQAADGGRVWVSSSGGTPRGLLRALVEARGRFTSLELVVAYLLEPLAPLAAPGGIGLTVLPSTAAGGAVSRIVARLRSDAAVTLPQRLVDRVVTEHGAPRLRGLDPAARARALRSVAEPRFVAQLGDA